MCAVKVSHRVDAADALAREAALLQQLDHPSIVQFIAQGQVDATAYLATQWVSGRRLADVIRDSAPLQVQRALALHRQIAAALQHAHDCGVVHADISTANILVDDDDSITLLDFGIGRQTDLATVTADTDFTGTLRYVAPEVIKGERPGAYTDQYAIAVILYELLTGCWPYHGEATAASALHNHLYSEPVSAQERNPNVSDSIDGVLLKSLSKDPLQRFASVAMMADALESQRSAQSSISSHTTAAMRSGASTSALIRGSAIVVALAGLFSGVVWQQYHSVSVSPTTSFSEAIAAEAKPQCNLLKDPAIGDNGIVENFYGEDGLPDRIALRFTDADNWQLTIGKSNHYGLYGQIVAVQPNRQYQLSATIQRDGYVHIPALRIEWLDADYQIQPDLLIEYGIEDLDDGLINMPAVQVPQNAAYAVPTIYKDEIEGTMTVTGMYFTTTDCN